MPKKEKNGWKKKSFPNVNNRNNSSNSDENHSKRIASHIEIMAKSLTILLNPNTIAARSW